MGMAGRGNWKVEDEMISGVFGSGLFIALVVGAVAPLAISDWQNARPIAVLASIASVGSVALTAITGDLSLFVFGWCASAILAALSRIAGLKAVELVRGYNGAVHPRNAHQLGKPGFNQ
jgi:hypothetical protein